MILPIRNKSIRRKRRGASHLRSNRIDLLRRSAVIALSLSALTGCGNKDGASTRQVVARVNGQEITIHQLKNELAAFPGGAEIPNATPTRETLDSLIDEQLLMEQGKERKIDRDPQVVQAEERAKRQIRLQVLQNHLVSSLPQPTQAEIRSFYEANPGLFANRKIYTFRQFTINGNGLSNDVTAKLDHAKTEEAIVGALKGSNLNFNEIVTVRTAEQLPLQALPSITNMKRGDVAVFKGTGKTDVLQVVDFVEQPATVEQATPLIREYLLGTRKKAAVDDLLRTLRATAKIEYLGTFAKDAPATAQTEPHVEPTASVVSAETKVMSAGKNDQPPSTSSANANTANAGNKEKPVQSVMQSGRL